MTSDAIQHFVWGIGDDNPLWTDRGSDLRLPWGHHIAPPTFLYAVDETTVAPGHDDQRRLYRSVEWTWHDVLREGLALTATIDLVEESSTPDGIVQVGEVRFTDEHGTELARARTTCRRTADPAPPIADRPELRYSGPEIDEIEQRILAEQRQGVEIRYVEDVEPGDDIPEVVKGPLSIMDVVAWCAATQGVADDADNYGEGGLHDETATGPQQVAWIGQALTNWMSDAGFLRRLQVDITSNPPLGSTTTISGRVTRVDGQAAAVGIELAAISESGEVTAEATATVLLPSRQTGPVVVPVAT